MKCASIAPLDIEIKLVFVLIIHHRHTFRPVAKESEHSSKRHIALHKSRRQDPAVKHLPKSYRTSPLYSPAELQTLI